MRVRVSFDRGPPDPAIRPAATVHRATGPNQVWSRDITYLPTTVRGRFLHLYVVADVWSRRIVAWRVHERESRRDRRRHDSRCNGKAMRGSTRLANLQGLGIVSSFSRPHVRDDNPYSEAPYTRAKRVKPERWSPGTRNWMPFETVVLHPERPSVAAA